MLHTYVYLVALCICLYRIQYFSFIHFFCGRKCFSVVLFNWLRFNWLKQKRNHWTEALMCVCVCVCNVNNNSSQQSPAEKKRTTRFSIFIWKSLRRRRNEKRSKSTVMETERKRRRENLNKTLAESWIHLFIPHSTLVCIRIGKRIFARISFEWNSSELKRHTIKMAFQDFCICYAAFSSRSHTAHAHTNTCVLDWQCSHYCPAIAWTTPQVRHLPSHRGSSSISDTSFIRCMHFHLIFGLKFVSFAFIFSFFRSHTRGLYSVVRCFDFIFISFHSATWRENCMSHTAQRSIFNSFHFIQFRIQRQANEKTDFVGWFPARRKRHESSYALLLSHIVTLLPKIFGSSSTSSFVCCWYNFRESKTENEAQKMMGRHVEREHARVF